LKKRRDIVKIVEIKERFVKLTDLGKEIIKQDFSQDLVEALTPEMIANGSWKGKKFRAYDVKSKVPKLNRGKRHFVDQSINYIKKIWLEMGFKEMEGNIVQTSFWDLDVLFVPQDHPAREMQDTFFVGKNKVVNKGKLPKISAIVKKVHEDGFNTNSKGWGGVWHEEIAKQVMLRTHTTVLSAQTLFSLKKEDLPAKFFSVNKVYRNEALDWKHLFEFYQVEGIVVDPNANFKHLIGYLKEFYKKMGYEKIRIRPGHFPYTEPSIEVEVFHPVKKEWVELGGAGIFRPEVTKTLLGVEVPVLAWGQGMERIITEYYKINDLRQLYNNDLKLLREAREWMK
jgi:phenylalanyl-tRNA synthetase alpha chain